MTVRIKVNVAGCVGHARCAAVAPEVYELDENGFNVTAEKEVPEALRAQAVRGMRACPERIISIEQEED
ncbi:ferredoxin [Sphingomonas histidinilytica]|jgi:ferredoxin|uniref:Ferredoxin n=1 Tax=Rhizorhabdus histidinilytica TaxID=439228 RepID=A0A1T5ERV6_9SPHN|nr:ferredoxin [Rhizorhabdus histidinilytica]MBO9376640.1 ferredoxin [Rhizorhabdus histidinilytica]QEH76909.1 ferredoxin [Sphingomonas sp. C8-2]SKB86539.1 ferredoxin [Rhizorhabdus histidinilytica]